MGRLDDAWRLHETAKAAGRESGRAAGLTYATAQQAYVLLDADRPADALGLVRRARQQAGRSAPPVLRAWLYAAEGEALAVLGDRDTALRALDAAAAVLPEQCDDPELPYLMLNAGHLARWRGDCLARLGDTTAVDSLTSALDAMGEGQYGRAEVSLRVDLALAFRARGDCSSRSCTPSARPTSPAAPARSVSGGASRSYSAREPRGRPTEREDVQQPDERARVDDPPLRDQLGHVGQRHPLERALVQLGRVRDALGAAGEEHVVRAADHADHRLERHQVLDRPGPVARLLLDLARGGLGRRLVRRRAGRPAAPSSRRPARTGAATTAARARPSSSSTTVMAAGGRVTVWCSNRSPDGCEMSASPTVTHSFS